MTEVNIEAKKEKVYFSELNNGDWFKDGGEICIKVNATKAYGMSSCSLYEWDSKTLVTPLQHVYISY